jgi:transposase
MKTDLNPPVLQQENDQLRQQNADLKQQLLQKDALIAHYLEQFRLMQKKQFGVSSEKNIPAQEQLNLFNEPEALADGKQAEPTVEEITYTRRKQKTTKEENLEDLVTEVVEHELTGAALDCPQCSEMMQEVKIEERYEIKIIPAKVEVVKHRQHIYACANCEANDIHTPFKSGQGYIPFLPKSSASAETVAWLLDQKYDLGLPLYRLEQNVQQQMGLNLSRQTMSNWILKTAELYIEPMYAEMRRQLLMQQHLHADETTLQVLKEPGRTAEQKSYMWMFRTGRGSPPMILYDYQTTRAAKHPVRFLEGSSGTLQVDGYAGYNQLRPKVQLAGCWAHVRRKFIEVLDSLPKGTDQTGSLSAEALKMIAELYAIESKLKVLWSDTLTEDAVQAIQAARQSKSTEICDRYFEFCKANKNRSTGKLRQALEYGLNEEQKLRHFLSDPSCEIDNNRAERAIKPFVMGRKAWLFSNTQRGARGSAMLYSLIVTAKENKLKIYDYLVFVLKQIPAGGFDKASDWQTLMPWSDDLPVDLRVK